MFRFFLIFAVVFCFSPSALAQRWLYGKWEGTGKEKDGRTWSMEFHASKGKFLIKYPSLKCGGE